MLATVLDAVKYAEEFQSYVVTDCLGYRRKYNHDWALKEMEQLEGLKMIDRKHLTNLQIEGLGFL